MVSDLISDYLEFTKIRNSCTGKVVDLSSYSWMFPTTMLPLITYLQSNGIGYVEPQNSNLSSYMSHMMASQNDFCSLGKTYVPFTQLPNNQKNADNLLSHVFGLPDIGKECGGEQAFKYVISELVDNIYEHSCFRHANMIAQKYPKLGFVDITILDDGISIPGCFEKAGMCMDDCDALIEAINGLSTKDKDRGFGLRSCIRIFTEGIKGQIFMASRNGAIALERGKTTAYKLHDSHKLTGTLITIRTPISPKVVDIYAYV